MSRYDREETRYQQGFVEGSRANRNNSASGIIVGIVVAAALCVGAWAILTQTGQQSGGDTDVINIPAPEAPEAPEAPKPPEININVPKPEIDVPKPEVDVPKPDIDVPKSEVDVPSPDNGGSEASSTN